MKGLDTLETFRQKHIPLGCAVVDIRLPDIDGLKLLKVIKFNYPQLPVIIITGHGSKRSPRRRRRPMLTWRSPLTWTSLRGYSTNWSRKAARPRKEAPREGRDRRSESVSMPVWISMITTPTFRMRTVGSSSTGTCFTAMRSGAITTSLSCSRRRPSMRIDELVEKEIKAIRGIGEVSSSCRWGPRWFGDNVVNIIGVRGQGAGQG